MPPGRKRKQPPDAEAETELVFERRQTRSRESAVAVPPSKRGRSIASLASSTSESLKDSLATATDSIFTTVTEPDGVDKIDADLKPVEATATVLDRNHEAQDTQIIEAISTDKDKNGTNDIKKPEPVTNGFKKAKLLPKTIFPPPYKLRKTIGKAIVPIPTLKTEHLNIYVFGTGSMSELGLGPDAKNKEVKRPRLNPFLPIDVVAIVDFAVGGAHVLAIDKKGKLWSWGCNDHGALGRDTSGGEEGLLRDMDADSDDDDGDLNPLESTPALVENLPDDLVFVRVAASDSLSLALTSEGRLWSWGTFRGNEGVLGFSDEVQFQLTPVQVQIPYPVCQIVAGKDHVMALTTHGKVFSWGNGQQFQLGRRVVERSRMQSLHPREFGIKNIKFIASGEFHAFGIDTSNRVMAWGLNQYGQCGIPNEGAGEDGAVVTSPTYVDVLKDKDIISIAGGEHHSIALSSTGDIYTFGRLDSSEVGIKRDELPDTVVKDAGGNPRFLPIPTKVAVADDTKFKLVTCGSHHNIALSKEQGSAWSWGFGETYQVGQGPAGEDVEVPTKIENTATRGVNMVLAGAGGQFSVLGGALPEQSTGDD
ncbi:regulator of chromosome condensation 1/beta-lactamase-inhibitor protein II [Lipomyces kononenkoae]|uniref:Regulator of chromosome condensation 1/beta-lactamase-inhibitor protein II n=1 Tax=Lipomyces kononenkoae TaxID=34357 RepID=A0ACC3T104_LIPKO